jgi:hypothetical protein
MKKLQNTSMLLRATLVLGASTSLLVGCNNSGNPVYGPGSTGNIAKTTSGSTTGGGGSTSGGATGGGGGSVGSFAAVGALNTARAQHTATALGDGRVLVTGGSDGQGVITRSEVFDPTTNAWTDCTSLTSNQNDGLMIDATSTFATARQLHTATLLNTGQVLVVGGLGVERKDAQGNPVFEAMKSAYIFDPSSNKFTAAPSMTEGRGWHTAALLSNGKLLVAGGLDAQMSSLVSAAVFDPNQGTWAAITPGAGAKHTWGSMVTTQGQTILVGGADVSQGQQGLQLNGFPTPRVERFDAQSNGFTTGPQNVGDRVFMGVNAISTGKALFAGGEGVSGQQLAVVDTTELYDGSTNTFSSGPTLNVGRFGAEVAEIATSSDQLIVGGADAQGAPTPVCEVYGAYGNTIIGTVNMQTPRTDFKAVTLRDGRVLVVGGFDSSSPPKALDSCEAHTR